MEDKFGRKIDYMRVSVTDRCDLRCVYCMPEGCEKVPMSRILTYEETERIVKVSADLGISRIRITGGEPFVRRGCVDLMRKIKGISGIEKVTVTTNGQTLEKYIDELVDIGMDGINISLDTLDPERFRQITGGGELANTLRGIESAVASGIRTKINCLILEDFNEDEIIDLAELAFKWKIDVRFIEMMPIGAGGAVRGVSNAFVLEKLTDRWPDLTEDSSIHGSGPAVYYKRPGAEGALGLISPIHGVFCSDCNRVRLTSQGQLKPCLCYDIQTDLRPYLEGTDDELRTAIRDAIYDKPEAHCFTVLPDGDSCGLEQRLMSQIGG